MNKELKKDRFEYGKKPTTALSFGLGNAKLSSSIGTFSLPAGWSCPFARDCLSKAERYKGHITDGEHCEFRCFAASGECTFPSVRASRWNNFEALRAAATIEGMAQLIQASLPFDQGFIRVHVSGDFFNEKYFLAWLNVALNNPRLTFYGYTKALPFIVKYKNHLPKNFRFTASKGGTHDHLIAKHKLRFAEVVFSVKEAEEKGLEIDHDDDHASFGDDNFALLIHGPQPAGSKASDAMKALKGASNYSEEKKQSRLNKVVNIYVPLKGKELAIAA